LLALFEKYKDGKGKQAKLKTPIQLQEVLDITKDLQRKLRNKQVDTLSGQQRVQQADDEVKSCEMILHGIKTLNV
jgi:hypothetical protein